MYVNLLKSLFSMHSFAIDMKLWKWCTRLWLLTYVSEFVWSCFYFLKLCVKIDVVNHWLNFESQCYERERDCVCVCVTVIVVYTSWLLLASTKSMPMKSLHRLFQLVHVVLIPETLSILPSLNINEGWNLDSMILNSWMHAHLFTIHFKKISTSSKVLEEW